jgi:hypothetical protein
MGSRFRYVRTARRERRGRLGDSSGLKRRIPDTRSRSLDDGGLAVGARVEIGDQGFPGGGENLNSTLFHTAKALEFSISGYILCVDMQNTVRPGALSSWGGRSSRWGPKS